MLCAVNSISPRGVYVCGSYSSTTGLTVTLLRESGSGDYAIEAGALVLADQGICCIDEFDKMSTEHSALLEAMEQQSVSIAKAGIVCTLPARTSVIAAANPVGGHYNKGKTVSENLKMNVALLSRFDLIFILLDKPDEERDRLLSEHVMNLHEGFEPTSIASVNPQIVEALEVSSVSQRNLREERISQQFGSAPCKNSLSNRLRVLPGEDFEPLHPILLRKYIAYARKYVCPKLTKGASKVIQDFYLSLRTNHRSSGGTPITTRQLESLIRLSEAKAKVEMREEVTEQDALDVIEIMKESLFDRFENEFGNLDFRRSSGMSMTKEVGRFLVQLQKISSSEIKSIFTYQELQQVAKSIHLQIANFEDFIDILNTQAHLIKKGPRVYKLMT